MPVLSFFAIALIVASLFSASARAASPSAYEEFKRFLSFRIGMTQQEFRYTIPRGWLPTAMMYSKKQNRNFIGEYNEGYFEYKQHPRATLEPLFTFRFWESKLTEADGLLIRRDVTKNAEVLELSRQLVDLVSKRFRNPVDKNAPRGGSIVSRWVVGDVEILVQAAEKDPRSPGSIGQVEVRLRSLARYPALREFNRRRKKEVHTGKFVATVLCSRRVASGAKLELGFSTDTRHLSKTEAQIIGETKKETLEKSNYQCILQIDDRASEVNSYENMFSGRRILKTYLNFIDRDGLVNTLLFVNAKGKVEDKLCEVFRKNLGTRSARCITGTELFHVDK